MGLGRIICGYDIYVHGVSLSSNRENDRSGDFIIRPEKKE